MYKKHLIEDILLGIGTFTGWIIVVGIWGHCFLKLIGI